MSIALSSNGLCVSKAGKRFDYDLPPLPHTQGKAGMFAGVSHGKLICLGGADFPDEYPWEGGTKKWYDDAYIWEETQQEWQHVERSMPLPLGYGVSASYADKVWIVGGSNEQGHLSAVRSAEYDDGNIKWRKYPDLPHALANMSGALVGSLLIIVGGMETPVSSALRTCYGLDLDQPDQGWFVLPVWPGPERIFPVCGTYNGKLYMFSGEHTIENSLGNKQRHILQDAYSFQPRKDGNLWTRDWIRLGDMPRGMSAAASPSPLIHRERFRLWGGVDRVTALHTDPVTHPGISATVLWYYPETDSWRYDLQQSSEKGRVTLPTVLYQGSHYYISGEIRPGVRTNSIMSVRNK
ncbi:hypothetical protein G5B30_13060 [Sphingobacterium sp. SGG-5]|uniref:hypothetical protein n=1 Tax=Sphingobacterium sp. SGG-5 TaxID=2710881 RepID=UPI0013ED1F90|nr:hypothetical protein [Sphingobacterium sp. SGG-5]NGM62840.1 hypothetical protein [Sphingobacterium sp. SGG-5]